MLYITVMLYGKNGILGEFKDYETKALSIFKQYGGEIIAAYRPIPGGPDTPDEIQILKIAGRAELDAFMNDPARLAMAGERSHVIRRTDTFLSDEMVEY
jgi:uncharacterized protein (DUF1330 family)